MEPLAKSSEMKLPGDRAGLPFLETMAAWRG